MKHWQVIFIAVVSLFVCLHNLSAATTASEKNSSTAELKAAKKLLTKHLKEAKELSNLAQKPNFDKARKEIVAAKDNPCYEGEKTAVLLEAGNVEYNCYDAERNKPASGKNIDYNILYPATENGFSAYNDVFKLYKYSDRKLKKKAVSAMQKKAWTLFAVTDGFRANGAFYFENKKWNAAHNSFQLFIDAVQSDILNDLAGVNSEVNDILSQYKNDTIMAHARYFRTISALQMDSVSLAIKELEEIKYDHFKQNVVLQELCNLYQQTGNEEKRKHTLIEGADLLPDEPWYARNLVNIYLVNKEYDLAEEMTDRLLKIDSVNHENLTLKGQLVEIQGNADSALYYYEKALFINPTSAEINSYIGRIWFKRATDKEDALKEKGKYEKAEAQSMTIYLKAIDYYLEAYKYDVNHEDKTIANAIRSVRYRQFTKANCPNKNELIGQYNEVSRAYGLPTFPR